MAKIICDGHGEIFSARDLDPVSGKKPQDVYFVTLNPGDRVINGIFMHVVSVPSVAMLDHAVISKDGGTVKTSNLRQIASGTVETLTQTGYLNQRMRKICLRRGAKNIVSSDGILPLINRDEVCIADFVKTGNTWLLMPRRVYHEITRYWAAQARHRQESWPKKRQYS